MQIQNGLLLVAAAVSYPQGRVGDLQYGWRLFLVALEADVLSFGELSFGGSVQNNAVRANR